MMRLQAQQNYVITVPLSNGSTAYIWTASKYVASFVAVHTHILA